jgi:hypothetical protein
MRRPIRILLVSDDDDFAGPVLARAARRGMPVSLVGSDEDLELAAFGHGANVVVLDADVAPRRRARAATAFASTYPDPHRAGDDEPAHRESRRLATRGEDVGGRAPARRRPCPERPRPLTGVQFLNGGDGYAGHALAVAGRTQTSTDERVVLWTWRSKGPDRLR